ncbi:MAG: TetR/AcrR family transcriptional regulator [Leptospirillia bacterium]
MNIKRNTRERILAAACSEFGKHGYHGTSMRKLAERVGIRPASLYSHFPSKSAILAEVSRPDDSRKMLATLTEGRGDTPPGRFFENFIEELVSCWTAPDSRLRRESQGTETNHDPLLASITSLFIEWQEQSLLRDDFSADQLAWEFLAPLDHLAATHWQHEQDEVCVRRGVSLAWRHVTYFLTRNTPSGPDGNGV